MSAFEVDGNSAVEGSVLKFGACPAARAGDGSTPVLKGEIEVGALSAESAMRRRLCIRFSARWYFVLLRAIVHAHAHLAVHGQTQRIF